MDDLGENEDGESPVAFLPSLSKTYTMWYKGCYMTIRREQVDDVRSWSRSKEVLEIRYGVNISPGTCLADNMF